MVPQAEANHYLCIFTERSRRTNKVQGLMLTNVVLWGYPNVCPFWRTGCLHWILPVNKPGVKMSRFQPQCCLVNLQCESSFPIQNSTKHIFGNAPTPSNWYLLHSTLLELSHQGFNLYTIEKKSFVVSLNSPFPPARVRGSSYWCGRNGIKYFSKYPSWQSIDQRGRGHFNACSPEWTAVSQRTFSMLPPLFTSIYYCWTGFSISKCPEM